MHIPKYGSDDLPQHCSVRFDESTGSTIQTTSHDSLPALFHPSRTTHTQPRPPNYPPPKSSGNLIGRRASNYPQQPPSTAPSNLGTLSNLCRRPSPTTVPFRRRFVVRAPQSKERIVCSADVNRPKTQPAARRASGYLLQPNQDCSSLGTTTRSGTQSHHSRFVQLTCWVKPALPPTMILPRHPPAPARHQPSWHPFALRAA
jgi:hypothetical protein